MSKRRISLVFVLVILVFVVVFLVDDMSTLNPGLGFGRDVRLIVDVQENPSQLVDFLDSQLALGREVYVDSIAESIKMVSFSGIADYQIFLNQISSRLWGTSILAMGTFGSLSNLGQFMATFEFYVSMFVLGFTVFWTVRYKLLGLFSALINFMGVFSAVLILNAFDYPFTYLVWFSVLLGFCIMLFQHTMLLHTVVDPNFIHSTTEDRKLLHKFIMQSLAVLVMAVSLYVFDLALREAARYFTLVALYMLVVSAFIPLILSTVRKVMLSDSEDKWMLNFTQFSRQHTDKALRLWGIVVVSGLITVLMGGIFFNSFNVRTNTLSDEYARKTLFLIDAEDAQSFIEMQASFATTAVLPRQVTYMISEEGAMWFVFDEHTNISDLELASESIHSKIGVEGRIFQYHSLENPLTHFGFYILVLVSVVAGYLIANTHRNRYGLLSLLLSGLTLGIYWLWFSLFSVGLSRVSILLTVVIPVLSAFVLVSTPDDLKDYTWNRRVVYITVSLSTLCLAIGLPILLIIPNPSDSIETMVSALLIWCLALVSSFVATPLVLKGSPHDKIQRIDA